MSEANLDVQLEEDVLVKDENMTFVSRLSLVEFKREFLLPIFSSVEGRIEIFLGKRFIHVVVPRGALRIASFYFTDPEVEVYKNDLKLEITSEKWREYMSRKFGVQYVEFIARYMRSKLEYKRWKLKEEKAKCQRELRKLQSLI